MSAPKKKPAPPGKAKPKPQQPRPKPPHKAEPKPKPSGAARGQRPEAAPSAGGSRLAALVDGRALPDAEARALWAAFSAWLDDHELDFAGFAAQRGWAKVKPEHRAGRAVLVVDTGASGGT